MCDQESSRFVKRRMKFDSVDVHPVEKALVVFYRIEAVAVSPNGETVAGEKKECQKMIKVQSLNSTTDIAGLAKEVVHQCKLIPASKLNEVQQLLSYIQQRPDKLPPSKIRPISQTRNEELESFISATSEQASMSQLDSYIELLYEEVPGRIRGTGLILQLAKDTSNLQELIQNEALVGALYRVLREDGRRHYALAVNIGFTFFYFASYSAFHPVLIRFKIGSLLMDIIRWELQRFDQWEAELKTGQLEQEELHRKIHTALLQQTLLIRTSCYVLLHLSEDPSIEDKMRKKGIVSLLVRILQRRYHHPSIHELNYLALTFLQKVAIFEENKNDMAQLGVIEKAAALLDCPHHLVQEAAARVLYNLSFDTSLRLRIGRLGLLPSLMRMMADDTEGTNVGWALVYQISLDDRGRIQISRSECCAFVLEYLLRRKETPLPSIPIALAVNLALVPRLANDIIHSKYFPIFLDAAVANHDAVLVKMLRNATGHAIPLPANRAIMEKILDAVHRNPDDYFQSEALGLFANLGEYFTEWSPIITEKRLLSWLEQHLKPGTGPLDIQLAAILVLRSVAAHTDGSRLMVESGILRIMVDLLRAQQEDDEFVLQILHVFYRLLRNDQMRSAIIDALEDVPACFLDLMSDQNIQVRKVCESALVLIAESDAKWHERIKNERFCWHNAQWLEAVGKSDWFSSPEAEENGSGSGSVLDLCVRHADFLDRASTSASSFGSPIGSPTESYINWDSHNMNHV